MYILKITISHPLSLKINEFSVCKLYPALVILCTINTSYFSVVSQYYEAQVYDMFVIRGNTAIFKCSVPSFVSDYVYVESWEATNGEKYFTQSIANDGRYFQ